MAAKVTFEYLKYQAGRSLTPRYTEAEPGTLIYEHMEGLCGMGLYRKVSEEDRIDHAQRESGFLAGLAQSEAKAMEDVDVASE